jgi:recombination protein RecA
VAQTALSRFAATLDKKYGAQRIARGAALEYISTGSLGVDRALRKGGVPKGRIVELVGPPDAGKSTLAITMMAAFQRLMPGMGIWYIDIEKTFDYLWAESLGLDTTPLDEGGTWLHTYPETSEHASDMLHDATRVAGTGATGGLFGLAVVDSIGGMESQKAFDKDAAGDIMGKNAQVITRMVKRTASMARLSGCTVLLVNQHRANLSGYGGDLSAGPKAMSHATTVKMTMRPASGEGTIRYLKYDGHEEPVAVKRMVKVDRSKVFAPGGRAEIWINNRHTDQYGPPGINIADEYASLGIATGVIAKTGGSWLTVPGAEKVNGKAAVATLLMANPDLLENVRAGVLASEDTGLEEITEDD